MGVSSVNSHHSSALNSANQQAQAEALLTSLKSQPTLIDVLNGSESGSSNDILDLSSAGQSAADGIYTTLQSALISRAQSTAQETSESMAKKLKETLAAKGINVSQEIDLGVDEAGKVVVTNNNAEKVAIEAAINGDADLKGMVTNYFSFMKSAGETLSSGSGSQSTSGSGISSYIRQLWSEFGRNPDSSRSTSETSTNDKDPTVSLRMKGNAFEVDYQGGDDTLARILAASS